MWLIVCRSYHQWGPEGAVWCQELNRPPLLLNECRTTSDRARERTPQETRTPEDGVSSHGRGTTVCSMIFRVKGDDFIKKKFKLATTFDVTGWRNKHSFLLVHSCHCNWSECSIKWQITRVMKFPYRQSCFRLQNILIKLSYQPQKVIRF